MLTYASQVMYNWRRFDRQGPVEVGNLHMMLNFLGGMDEPFFVHAAQEFSIMWRLPTSTGPLPVEVGNLHMMLNFLGGMDEEWFVTIHIHIEAVAGRALTVLIPGQEAVPRGEAETIVHALTR